MFPKNEHFFEVFFYVCDTYFKFLEIILWLDFMCSWWILKSFEKFWKYFGDSKHIKTQIG